MAKYEAISLDEILNIAARAAGGDNDALRELGRRNSQYGRAANQRARELEKRKMRTGAYVRAASNMGINRKDLDAGARPRFSQAKTGDAEHLLQSIEETIKFLNYQTGTVSGEMKRREHIIEGLERAGYNIGNDKQKFLDFLDSDAWTEIKDIYGSKDAMQKVSDNMASGADIEKLMTAYENYITKESTAEDILQVLDGWMNAANSSGNN